LFLGSACDRAALGADPSAPSQGQDSLNPDGEERGNPARLEPRGREMGDRYSIQP
jgi:hypothetical protein